jgi:hypothetical protein
MATTGKLYRLYQSVAARTVRPAQTAQTAARSRTVAAIASRFAGGPALPALLAGQGACSRPVHDARAG